MYGDILGGIVSCYAITPTLSKISMDLISLELNFPFNPNLNILLVREIFKSIFAPTENYSNENRALFGLERENSCRSGLPCAKNYSNANKALFLF